MSGSVDPVIDETSLAGQAAAVARGDVSPVELVEATLDRIADADDRTNAFTRVFAEQAVEDARRLRDEPVRGPLHGVPLAVKDLYDVAGHPTTGCCSAYEDRIARTDAAVVEALRGAGAIIVAKTNQHELAFGVTNLESSFGPTRNPWDPERITGGSSGGSGAAVAMRAVACALGSDTGGSIRIPSSFCGVTGLKPTHGAVSLRGVMPLAPTLDTAGPLAVSADDCLLVWDTIAGFDPDDPHSRDGRTPDRPQTLERMRIAIPQTFMRSVTTDVREALESVARWFEAAGCLIDEIEGPDVEAALEVMGYTTPAECAHHHPTLATDERVGEGVRHAIAFGAQTTATTYLTGRDIARGMRRDFEWALTSADALLAPCTPFGAPRTGDETIEVEGGTLDAQRAGVLRLTAPVNVAGLPSLAFPMGFSPSGVPLGAQLVGRDWSEPVLCFLAGAYQSDTDWHLHAPRA